MDDGHSIAVMMPKIARKTLGLSDAPFSRVQIEAGGLCFRAHGISEDKPVVVPVSMVGTFHHDLLNNL